MSRLIVVGLLSAFIGVIGGIVVERNLWPDEPFSDRLAVIDVAGVVERQREEVLKKGKDPEEMEKMIMERMIRLSNILAEMGQEQVILNKAAMVSGPVRDITKSIEDRLTHEE